MLNRILLAVVSAPFADNSATKTTIEGAKNATKALEGSRNAGEIAAKQLSYLWDMYTKSDGLFWLIMYQAITPLLIIGFIAWAFKAVYDQNVNGLRNIKKEAYLAPFFVAVMLANNGMLMSWSIQAVHLIPKSINDGILNTAIQGVTGRQKIQEGLAKSQYNQIYTTKRRSCIDPKTKDQCEKTARDEAQAIAEQSNPNGTPITKKENLNAGDWLSLPGAITMAGIRLGMTGAIIGVLSTLSYGSHMIFGLIKTMWAGLGLVFLGLHLIPGAWNLKVFFSGFLGICVAIIFNSAWQVATSIMLATASDWDPLILPLLNGFVGPLFSLAIAYLGISGSFALIGAGFGGVARVMGRRR